MKLPVGHTLLGVLLGTFCTAALVASGPGVVMEAFGDEFEEPAINTENLVIFEDVAYTVEHADWVATEPLSTARVQKIEAGRISYVDIATTPTGVYSSDAMFSRHVQYPGITVARAPWPHNRNQDRFSYWSHGKWTALSARQGNSYVSLVTVTDARGRTRQIGCIATANALSC